MYGRLSIGVVLTITQLLSMFGLFADVNVMVWGYYGWLAEPLLQGVMTAISLWAYDQAYQQCNDSNNDGCEIMETIETDLIKHAIAELAIGGAIHENHENWMAAQFMALPEEKQKEWMEAHIKEEMDKKDHMMMKAKELGIEMGKMSDSEWSEESGMESAEEEEAM